MLSKHGLGYASAVAMEEVTLLDYNREAGDGDRLVAIYPEEGTFVSDNPLITLRGDWVSADQRKAGAVFAGFLAEQITPEVAGRHGFRPADEDQAPAWIVPRRTAWTPSSPPSCSACPSRSPRPPQDRLAGRPQARERDRRVRQLGVDGRGEQARPGQGGVAHVLPRGRSRRTGSGS